CPFPPPFLLPRALVELSSSRVAASADSRHPLPPCLIPRAPSRATSPSTSFAPSRAHSSQPRAEPAPAPPAAIAAPHRSSAPPSIPYLQSTSARFEGAVS